MRQMCKNASQYYMNRAKLGHRCWCEDGRFARAGHFYAQLTDLNCSTECQTWKQNYFARYLSDTLALRSRQQSVLRTLGIGILISFECKIRK